MTEREEFEAWANVDWFFSKENPFSGDTYTNPVSGKETWLYDDDTLSAAFDGWQAAIAYERERCAMICQNLPMKTGFPGNSQFDCAEAIRKGVK